MQFDFARSFMMESKRRQQPFVLSIAVKEFLNEQIDKRRQEVAARVGRNTVRGGSSPADASESAGRNEGADETFGHF